MDTHGAEERKVIETASATTSPDNANSGSFAYIVTAVTVLALLVSALLGGVIISAAAGIMVTSGAADLITDIEDPSSPLDLEDDSFNDFLEQYYENLLGDEDDENEKEEKEGRDDKKSVSVADALDFDLAPYLVSIDSEVPASSYAGAPQEVRDFVRQLMGTDTLYADQIRSELNAAAVDPASQEARIKSARSACDDAREALDALEVPNFTSVTDSSVRDLLGEAKGEAGRRFELMATEIDLLATDGDVDTQRLWDADDKVVESCESAAEKIIEAMTAAAAH